MKAFITRLLLALLSATLLAGCASTPRQPGEPPTAAERRDPLEGWNRKVFAFNEGVDEYVLEPVARGYRKVVPSFVRTGVNNFFNNALDGWSAVNLLLQGRFEDGLNDMMRFAVNTAFGIGGVIDIAGDMGFEHHYEDFGQTLGKWGFGSGAYIVWPLLGPSSVRDSFALPLDRAATPAILLDDRSARAGLTVLQVINARANFLDAARIIDDIALDKYTFIRDAYLARRRNLVYDGDPPPEDEPAPPPPADPGGSAPSPAPPR